MQSNEDTVSSNSPVPVGKVGTKEYLILCAGFAALLLINDWFVGLIFVNETINGLIQIIGYSLPLLCAVILALGTEKTRIAGFILMVPALAFAVFVSYSSGADQRFMTGKPGFFTLIECKPVGGTNINVCKYERKYWPTGGETFLTSEKYLSPVFKIVRGVP